MKQTEMEKRVEGWLQTNWTRKAEEAWEENKERRVGFVSTFKGREPEGEWKRGRKRELIVFFLGWL